MTNSIPENTPEEDATTEVTTPAIDLLRDLVDSKPGGEHRPQQERMATLVEEAINNGEHLLVQSGTGTGKTLGYAVAAVAANKRTVISTATKQLSEQIVRQDLPVLRDAVKKRSGENLNFTLLKGRENYLCLKKLNENQMSDPNDQPDLAAVTYDGPPTKKKKGASKSGLPGSQKSAAEEYEEMYDWADDTDSGDRTDAPAVSDKTWQGFSMSNSDCPGRSICPFGAECFAELARDKARAAQIVVTNHAVVGADRAEGNLLGERDVLIADELHELDSYLSSAWGTELTPRKLSDVATAIRKSYRGGASATAEKDIQKFSVLIDAFTEYAMQEEAENYTTGMPSDLTLILTEAKGIIARYTINAPTEKPTPSEKVALNKSKEMLDCLGMLTATTEDVVRWSERPWTRPGGTPTTLIIKAAPLRIGPELMQKMETSGMTFIGTSATVTVAGGFAIPVRNFALDEPIGIKEAAPRKFMTADTGTPFDYAKQGIMYFADPEDFPAPVGKERLEHSEAVKERALEIFKASRGRGLMLSATTKGAMEIGDHLRANLDVPVLIQGEAPTPALVEEFKKNINSVLVATLGLWHGLDAPGETLSVTVIDKIPFKRMDDPLMQARQKDVEARGGNGFMDVYVADANIMLAQGTGRLIRHTTDRGIVAVLDPRMISKRYGSDMMRSLPPMYRTTDFELVLKSLKNI